MLDKPIILGCDEVGYGCLAGPLVVVGVRAPKDWTLAGLNDSKKLSAKKREAMLLPLMKLVQNKEISYHLAERSNAEIDKVGVAVALKDAYVECFHALYQSDCLIINDGILKFDGLGVDAYDKVSVIKADAKFPAVMAASIIAKTYRDDKMHILHNTYPAYGWDSNVGYGSKIHLDAIEKHGPCPLHRFSYAPMKNIKAATSLPQLGFDFDGLPQSTKD
jgi:ribonuclease HII